MGIWFFCLTGCGGWMTAPLDSPSTTFAASQAGKSHGRRTGVSAAVQAVRSTGCPRDTLSKGWITCQGLEGMCSRGHFAAALEWSSTLLFVARCWQQDTGYPSGKLIAFQTACCRSECWHNTFPLSLPPPFSLSAFWVLSVSALQELLHDIPWWLRCRCSSSPGWCSECNKQEQGAWWCTASGMLGFWEGPEWSAGSLAEICHEPPSGQTVHVESCLLWALLPCLAPTAGLGVDGGDPSSLLGWKSSSPTSCCYPGISVLSFCDAVDRLLGKSHTKIVLRSCH